MANAAPLLRRNEIAGLFGILIAASALGALGRGNWLHQVLSLGVLLWVGIPMLACLVFAVVKGQRPLAMLSSGVFMLAGFQIAVGMVFLHWDIFASQRYCESLVPVLDLIYAEAGQYPFPLEDDHRLNLPRPRFVDRRLIHYNSDGATFSFEVSNPAEIFGGYIYSHSDRRWIEWRD